MFEFLNKFRSLSKRIDRIIRSNQPYREAVERLTEVFDADLTQEAKDFLRDVDWHKCFDDYLDWILYVYNVVAEDSYCAITFQMADEPHGLNFEMAERKVLFCVTDSLEGKRLNPQDYSYRCEPRVKPFSPPVLTDLMQLAESSASEGFGLALDSLCFGMVGIWVVRGFQSSDQAKCDWGTVTESVLVGTDNGSILVGQFKNRNWYTL